MAVEYNHTLGIGLPAALVALSVLNLWVATAVGDANGQFLGLVLMATGVILVVKQVRFWQQDIRDRAARDLFFKNADAQPIPPSPSPGGRDSLALSGGAASPEAEVGAPSESHALVKCPFCGTFEPRQGSVFCRGCGRRVFSDIP